MILTNCVKIKKIQLWCNALLLSAESCNVAAYFIYLLLSVNFRSRPYRNTFFLESRESQIAVHVNNTYICSFKRIPQSKYPVLDFLKRILVKRNSAIWVFWSARPSLIFCHFATRSMLLLRGFFHVFIEKANQKFQFLNFVALKSWMK